LEGVLVPKGCWVVKDLCLLGKGFVSMDWFYDLGKGRRRPGGNIGAQKWTVRVLHV